MIGPSSPFESLFKDFVSHFPSVNSLDLIAPTLGLASGMALYISRIGSDGGGGGSTAGSDVGEWVLFTSPTPFNRFVVLRCPSISLEGNDLLEEANEKLVKEERHYVRLDSGRIRVRDDNNVAEKKLVYQRVCVSTNDGGVISLDWPVNLELTEEHGLDTTLLLIPGSAQGSMDKNVRAFVCESLKHGCFPIVMNPRGCAGSPLTTARLFTAADSDDISAAVQFICRARPWTTMMGVGWGYGANMLTKYLAEVGEGTPLTAATCIDNPFDLEEASRSSPHHIVHKLTGGLVDILQSNKELFRGRAKGFDVEKALVAKCVRDFDKAISMISYGHDTIEDFYENSSSRRIVGEVKIPVLFIHNDDGGAPLFSIPRCLIAENPFTSLLLCSCSSSVAASGKPAINWCHHLTIEWLAAVELGLLKGRHPLLKDVDVALNPSKRLATVTSSASDRPDRVNKLLKLSQSDFSNGYGASSLAKMVGEGDTPGGISSKYIQDKNPEFKDEGLREDGNVSLEQEKRVDAEFIEDEVGPENDIGQVLQAAKVVMNMLDVTMPDTLTEEQKKKVLIAVGQGETVMKALQDVVPDDVRGKLKNAVSEFLHSEGANLKLDKLLNISLMPNSAMGRKPRVQENVGFVSAGEHENPLSPNPMDRIDSVANTSGSNEVSADKQSRGMEPEVHASDSQMTANNEANNENASDSGTKPDSPGQPERVGDAAVDPNGESAKLDLKEDDNIQQSVETVTNSTTNEQNPVPPTKEDQGSSHVKPSSEAQTVETESNASVNIEVKNPEAVPIQGSTDAPIFKVSQALDALTGIDDSTQVAVNSVFGVIENMITQLEERKDDETKGDDKNIQVSDKYKVMGKEENKNKQSFKFDKGDEFPSYTETEADKDARMRLKDKERHISSLEHLNRSTVDSSSNPITRGHIDEEKDETRTGLVRSNVSSECSNNTGQYYDAPLYINSKPYSNTLYQEYLHKYLLMKMKSTKSLDLNSTTALFLDYFPEGGQWKLLGRPDVACHSTSNSPIEGDIDEVIEPSYIIMNSEEKHEPILEYNMLDDTGEKFVRISTSDELITLVKTIVLGALKSEVGRRLSAANSEDVEKLTRDAEEVANAVSVAARCSKNHKLFSDGKYLNSEKIGSLNGEEVVNALSLSIQETNYLRKVLPLGVVVGSSLASLRKYFNVAKVNGADQSEALALDQIDISMRRNGAELDQGLHGKLDHRFDDLESRGGEKDKKGLKSLNNGTVMVGAFTAALGASALLAQKEDSCKENETFGAFSKSLVKKGDSQDSDKLDEEKSQNNLVSSLAEKAMSVASPVVPMKEDGGVDQERLVAMLAELGQRGGILKLVGKVALLWGGMRGAMSLTNRLILFLQIAERPLLHRMLAFACMVLVLWSPIVIPLLPTLVQNWASQNTPKFPQFVCIAGLYASILILVMLWGKRIRGYENPSEQYGLDLTSSSKIKNYFMGLIGGVSLVLSIHSVNAFLGCVCLSWPSVFVSNPTDAMTSLKVICKMLLLVGQGVITATGLALVEELLFRSWLPDEIAADFGHNLGIIISGLAFALFQRSPLAIPGLWLLSLGLSGARERIQGSLSFPIGLHAGIMATSFVLQRGGFLTYKPNFPRWVTGSHPLQPFCDLVGLASALLLALFLYPSHPLQASKKRGIQE